jgi:hypothetical protein
MSLARLLSRFVSRKTQPVRRRRLELEWLEDRTLLTIQPVTLADPGLWGNSGVKDSSHPSISADGQLIAFVSSADNLVPNDNNGLPDAFVYDRSTGMVSLVSVGPGGTAAGIDLGPWPVISPDGRYVAFESGEAILPGISGFQLYLRDLTTGTTSLLSVAPDGTTPGNYGSSDPVFSAESHHVGFISGATNLVGNVTFHNPSQPNVFERDLTTGTTMLVSISMDGTSDGNAVSGPFALSADGSRVVFQSSASNLQNLDNSGIQQVYLRDMNAGTTTMVSVDSSGLVGAGGHNLIDADSQVISADGRYVVFHSNASNIVASGGSGCFLRDLQTDTTILLSASAVDGSAVGGNGSEVVSPDGRWAAFATAASNVVSQPTNGHTNVYVLNIQTGVLSLVSSNAAGTGGGNGNSGVGTFYDFPGGLSFSPNGEYLGFRSLATDLTPNVWTASRNLYVRNLDAGTTLLVTPNQAGTDGGNGDADTVSSAVFSADGRYIAFEDTAGNLMAGDDNGQNEVYLREVQAGMTALASVRSTLLPAAYTVMATGSGEPSISANGRYVAFLSAPHGDGTTDGLLAGVTFSAAGGSEGVYVRDTQTGNVVAADLDPSGVEVGATNFAPVITPDGRYVLFASMAMTLVSGVTYGVNHDVNLFIRDLQTNTTRIVTVDPTGTHDVSFDSEAVITPDGRYVAYTTWDPHAVGGTGAGSAYDVMVIVRDTQAGTNYLANDDMANDGQINGVGKYISISSDGRYVLFVTNAADLAPNDTNGTTDVFRYDRTTNQVALVSVNAAGTGPGNKQSGIDFPVMSADGRYVAFDSIATDLPGDDLNHPPPESVYLRDMTSGTTTSLTGQTGGWAPAISADGSTVAFIDGGELDSSLTPQQYVAFPNIYLWQGSSGVHLVSFNAKGSATANQGSAGLNERQPYAGPRSAPVLSADGRYVAFHSGATNLVAGFVNGNRGHDDIYMRDLKTGMTKLITYNQSGTAGANAEESGDNLQISADDSTLVFDSTASDLYAGDRNGEPDVFATSPSGFSSISGEVFNDPSGNGVLNIGEAGLPYWTVFIDLHGTGQLTADDPSVITDANGNYAFQGLKPGTYNLVAVPQLGYVQTTPTSPLTYTVTIGTDGAAITGKNFGEALPLPDLETSNVSFSPAASGPGQQVTFGWTVTNQGNAAAPGSWQDAIYLSPTATLGAGAQLLSTVSHDGGLGVNTEYNGSASLALPPLTGTWYVIVRTDWRNQVNEGAFHANKGNNMAVSSSTLGIAVPQLTLGQPLSDQFTSAGQSLYYQVALPAGDTLVVNLNGAAATENEIFVREVALPVSPDFDAHAGTFTPDAQLSYGPTQADTYYIQVHNQAGPAGGSAFTLTASVPDFAIYGISTTHGGNVGPVTIRVDGAGFDDTTTVQLVGKSQSIAASWQRLAGSTEIDATFNLTGAPAGTYDVRAVRGEKVMEPDLSTGKLSALPFDMGAASLAGAFQVVPGGTANVVTHFSLPSIVRTGHVFPFQVTVSNQGLADAPLPVELVYSPNGTPISTAPDVTMYDADQQQLVILGQHRRNVLAPGESVTVTLYALPNQPNVAQFEFEELSQMQGSIDWPSIEGYYQSLEPDANWATTWSNFVGIVGTSWASLHDAMRLSANDMPAPANAQFLTGTEVVLDLLERARSGQHDLSGFVGDTDAYADLARWNQILARFNQSSSAVEPAAEASFMAPPVVPDATSPIDGCEALKGKFTPAQLAEMKAYVASFVATVIPTLFGQQAAQLWTNYISSTQEHPAPPLTFGDDSELVNGFAAQGGRVHGFKDSPETQNMVNQLTGMIEGGLKTKAGLTCKSFPENSPVTLDLYSIVPHDQIQNWANNTNGGLKWDLAMTIPGNVAGGVSKYKNGQLQDSRDFSGSVTVTRMADKCHNTTGYKLEFNLTMTVKDVVDFCPGNFANVQPYLASITYPMAALEANDMANDAAFTVTFHPNTKPVNLPGDFLPGDCHPVKNPAQPPCPCKPPPPPKPPCNASGAALPATNAGAAVQPSLVGGAGTSSISGVNAVAAPPPDT